MIATAVRKLGIAPSHPLNRGLVSHFICLPGEMGGARLRNQARPNRYAALVSSSSHPSWWSSFGRSGGVGSIKFQHSGTTGGYLDQDHVGVSGYPLTLAAWVYSGGITDTFYRAVLCIGSDGANRGWCAIVHRGTTSTSMRFGLATDNNDLGGGTANDTNTTNYSCAWHHLCGVWESATSRRLYVDGVLLATYTGSVTFNPGIATGSTWLGAQNLRGSLSGNTALTGYADDWRVWNRGLTATEVWHLYNLTRRGSQRTLSMFGPMLHLLLNAASGGSTQDGTVSDGAKPGEAFAASVLGAGVVSDGAKPGDTLAGTARGAAALADGGMSGDSLAGAAVGASAVTNGSIAGDAAAAAATQAGSLSNGAVSGDSESGGNLVSASLSEGSAGSDTWSQIVTINLVWAEASTAGDAYTSTAIAVGVVSDGGTPGDAISAVATASALVSHGVVASDSFVGGKWTVSSWSDGASASDVWAATIGGDESVLVVGLGCSAASMLLEVSAIGFQLDVTLGRQILECEIRDRQ